MILAAAADETLTYMFLTTLFVFAHLLLQIALAIRVIMRRRQVGESLAWIMVIFVFPVVGPFTYLVLGELRLGRHRAARYRHLFEPIREWLRQLSEQHQVDWTGAHADYEPLARLAEKSLGVPPQPDNRLQLFGDWQDVFEHLIADINSAQHSCDLEFYIWHPGGRADEVIEAIIRAREREIACRILVDALGSRSFLKSAQVKRLRAAGVAVADALPGGLWRMPFVRADLRLHRKIVVIDDRVAYTGSLNLVDPRYFKQDAGVGQWVDAMVRIEGPAVETLAITFLADWYVETSATLTDLRNKKESHLQTPVGKSIVQVLPSGPAFEGNAIEQFLLMAIYAAREELVFTTPYFVPNESLRTALITAVMRGVNVVLVVPSRVDSILVRYASQAYKGDLLSAGVCIALFSKGLLHTKSVTVDRRFSLFGSVNLDPRSFQLNFEISTAIFDEAFTQQLRQLQQTYIDNSEFMDAEVWNQRTGGQRFIENVARMFEPLL